MSALTSYEQTQLEEIKKWKEAEPGVVSKSLGMVATPLNCLVRKVIPESAIRGALDFSNALAEWLTDTQDILQEAGVNSIEEIRNKPLELYLTRWLIMFVNGLLDWLLLKAQEQGCLDSRE